MDRSKWYRINILIHLKWWCCPHSVFPMSCMSLVEFAMTQLWQDHVKNMAWWVSKELWDSRDCVLIIRNTNFKAPLWGGGQFSFFTMRPRDNFISPRGTFGENGQSWDWVAKQTSSWFFLPKITTIGRNLLTLFQVRRKENTLYTSDCWVCWGIGMHEKTKGACDGVTIWEEWNQPLAGEECLGGHSVFNI